MSHRPRLEILLKTESTARPKVVVSKQHIQRYRLVVALLLDQYYTVRRSLAEVGGPGLGPGGSGGEQGRPRAPRRLQA